MRSVGATTLLVAGLLTAGVWGAACSDPSPTVIGRDAIVVFGPYRGVEADNFAASLRGFERATGIEVNYTNSAVFVSDLDRRLESGLDAPDIAIVPQPGGDRRARRAWRRRGVGPRHARDNRRELRRARREPHAGRSGIRGALPDLAEIVGVVPTRRVRALRLGCSDHLRRTRKARRLRRREGRTAGGLRSILQVDVTEASKPVFDDPAGCAMYEQATFAQSWFPDGVEVGDGVKFFVLPDQDADTLDPMLIGADGLVQFSEDDRVAQLMTYLVSPDGSRDWARRGGYISARTSVDVDLRHRN